MNAVIDLHKLIPAWQTLQSVASLVPIENDPDYEQARSLLKGLLELVRDNAGHPLPRPTAREPNRHPASSMFRRLLFPLLKPIFHVLLLDSKILYKVCFDALSSFSRTASFVYPLCSGENSRIFDSGPSWFPRGVFRKLDGAKYIRPNHRKIPPLGLALAIADSLLGQLLLSAIAVGLNKSDRTIQSVQRSVLSQEFQRQVDRGGSGRARCGDP